MNIDILALIERLNFRVIKVLQQLLNLTETFPLTDPMHQQMFEQLQAVRAKYKQVCIGVLKKNHLKVHL